MGLKDLVGKKINLVMADQLKVDDKRMGGPFFPLIPRLRGKVAWASMRPIDATKKIVLWERPLLTYSMPYLSLRSRRYLS